MFDFFGCFNASGLHNSTYSNPFEALYHDLDLNYRSEQFSTQVSTCYTLYNCSGKFIYANERYQVYVYGYVFSKIASGTNKKLSPEAIFKYYKKFGQQLVNHIKGSYSIIIVDTQVKSLDIVTDPFNLKEVFIYHEGESTFFCSSTGALVQYLNSIQIPVEINKCAVLQQHLFNFIISNDTLIKKIQRIAPATWFTVNTQGMQENTYYNYLEELPLDSSNLLSAKEGLEQIKSLFSQILPLYQESSEQTAISLTGGYDSRLILSMLENPKDYKYFSYGPETTWDIRIPQQIAKKLQLDYTAYIFNSDFFDNFLTYAHRALILGDGLGHINAANYPFCYSQLGKTKTSVLSGLFGSELIKYPSSRGLFINENMITILKSNNIANTLEELISFKSIDKLIVAENFADAKEELTNLLVSNPWIQNSLPYEQKLFYFILLLGNRNYFMRELKIERPYVTNFHPFYDQEFIELLVQTPFPWVFNFKQNKSLRKNLTIHKFYINLIQNHRKDLLNIVSTHGYKPNYLTSSLSLPLIICNYQYYKKRMFRDNRFIFDQQTLNFCSKYISTTKQKKNIFNTNHIQSSNFLNNLNTISSIYWLNNLKLL